MFFVLALGLVGVLFIMLRPLRFVKAFSPAFAAFGSKAFASMFFCLAGVAATTLRDRINWQAAALLFGFCLACLGDVVLAIEPVLKHPERDKNYAFMMGAVPFLLAHCLNLAVLISHGKFSPWLLPLILILPALYLTLWRCGLLRFGRLAAPLLLYSLVLGAMLWAAAQTGGTLRLIALPAACLFALSDTALFLLHFGTKKKPAGAKFLWLVMFPYYLAQTLLACAVAIV